MGPYPHWKQRRMTEGTVTQEIIYNANIVNTWVWVIKYQYCTRASHERKTGGNNHSMLGHTFSSMTPYPTLSFLPLPPPLPSVKKRTQGFDYFSQWNRHYENLVRFFSSSIPHRFILLLSLQKQNFQSQKDPNDSFENVEDDF